jgi:trans-aconitate 2-methyltransferase
VVRRPDTDEESCDASLAVRADTSPSHVHPRAYGWPMRWNPDIYRTYSDERSRPYFDLTAQIGATDPATVIDLGCGSGELTATLAERWPQAHIVGLDSSAEMLANSPDTEVTFMQGDIATWAPEVSPDVIVSNAALQWVPDHLPMVVRWGDALPAGGWLAFQVPANFQSPSHVLMRETAALPRWRAPLDGVLQHDVIETAQTYWAALCEVGCEVTTWDTTYLHVLQGEDPVLTWVRGTGLRPVLGALDPDESAAFEEHYAALLRAAYPSTPYGTPYPFLRRFVVAHKPG